MNDEEIDMLRNANSLLRSCYSIAQREGKETNWIAIKNNLELALTIQSRYLNKTDHLPAATATPRTFRIDQQDYEELKNETKGSNHE